jgi:ribosome-associated translation inhibitor RaiA
MQSPVQISFHNVEANEALRTEIERHVRRLDQLHPRITACRVMFSAPKTRHKSGQPYEISIRLTAPPHREIIVTRQHRSADEHPTVALNDAFAAAYRQLEDAVRKARADVKHHTT